MTRARCNTCGAWCATFADRRIMRAVGTAFEYRLAWAVACSPMTEELVCDPCLPRLVDESAATNDTATNDTAA